MAIGSKFLNSLVLVLVLIILTSIEQFRTLVNCPINALKFKSFKQKEDCLDQFYFETLKFPAKSSLGKLLQPLFVLHNDQAEVELD